MNPKPQKEGKEKIEKGGEIKYENTIRHNK